MLLQLFERTAFSSVCLDAKIDVCYRIATQWVLAHAESPRQRARRRRPACPASHGCKLGAAEDAFDARADELSKIGRRIFATPANTLEGMVVKLRAVDRMDPQSLPDGAFLSIAADIRRLAGAGVQEAA
jgi:hypothetical protein